ncbi:UvrD/REP helicase N-terminal domain-containing protein [Paenibacillus sp. UNCCL117]|nr:UvrD/REP helicase N-terminal domain-containing protein [Paenibacillus sp. cl123]SFW60746.1 UvrD/REP helicase N-terminal domain-containing protein [Paenibacillus sp. UNCCL117]
MELNGIQQQAAVLTEGPLLLLASPGSGKTTTVIMRIGYLLEEKGVDPARIKAVTFSRASAADMKSGSPAFSRTCRPSISLRSTAWPSRLCASICAGHARLIA